MAGQKKYEKTSIMLSTSARLLNCIAGGTCPCIGVYPQQKYIIGIDAEAGHGRRGGGAHALSVL